MELKDFFNEYWQDNATEEYAAPYIGYVEHIAKFYGKGADFFLFFLIALEVDFKLAKTAMWSDVSSDFTSISLQNENGDRTSIDLPKKLQQYVKENTPSDVERFIFSNPKIQKIDNDLGTFFLANLDLGKVDDFSSRFPEFENSFRHIIQPKENETRKCLHAWDRVEVGTEGGLAPCCNFRRIWDVDDDQQVENGYRHLRQSLLDGELNYLCQNCYIAPVTTKEELRKEVETKQKESNISDILSPLPTEVVCVSVTDKCNLRCVYCSVSHPDYAGKHMKDHVFDEALEYIYKSKPDARVELFGHGETTFHPKWRTYCRKAIDSGRKIHFVTNLASQLKDEDFDLLAKFDSIWVSLDSNDEQMMMKIRRKIKPKVVFDRIEKIRESAKRQNIKGPEISITVVVYDPSIWTITAFVEEVINIKIDGMNFQTLIELPQSQKGLVRNISHLNEEETQMARTLFREAIDDLDKNNIPYSIASSLICSDEKHLLQPKVELVEEEQSKKSKKSLLERLKNILTL